MGVESEGFKHRLREVHMVASQWPLWAPSPLMGPRAGTKVPPALSTAATVHPNPNPYRSWQAPSVCGLCWGGKQLVRGDRGPRSKNRVLQGAHRGALGDGLRGSNGLSLIQVRAEHGH